MEKYEQKVIAEYPKVVLVSKSDKVLLGNQKNIFVHTNGVNCISQLNDNYNPDKITFVGNMRTLQNQDAVLFFAKEIFPLVKEKKPDAFFEIIGAQPSEQIKELHDGKNIIVTGYVDSVEDELKDSCVAVAPVRIAAGIQNKVLVAMACGVPVVLTSLISQAIPELSDSINCFVQDSKEKIAEKIIDLMTDNNLRKLVARKGFEIVQENYSWNSKLDGYEILVQEQKN
jgi:glycosyltransferase involved in cell wall biosynthesis